MYNSTTICHIKYDENCVSFWLHSCVLMRFIYTTPVYLAHAHIDAICLYLASTNFPSLKFDLANTSNEILDSPSFVPSPPHAHRLRYTCVLVYVLKWSGV